MDLKIVKYSDVDRQTWDSYVRQIGEACYYHSSAWLNYAVKHDDIREHLSFVLLNHDGSAAAICPLAVSFDRENEFSLLSFSKAPCGLPALASFRHSQRRKVLDMIFDIFRQTAVRFGAKKVLMAYHSLHQDGSQNNSIPQKYSFELIRYQMLPGVINIAVLDLTLSTETLLSNVSKSQRKHIVRGQREGIEIKVFNRNHHSGQIQKRMKDFQELHLRVSGKATRPQETWDAMQENLTLSGASLFVAFLHEVPVSYLYCGEFAKMAFGWSQVNDPDFEQEYSPRHLLEWQAAMDYKSRGFHFYEVGAVFDAPQLFYIPTEKEKSISVFKERFGGIFLSRILWTGYYDMDLMRKELTEHFENYMVNVSLNESRIG